MNKARILIVDDDPFILDALRNLLRKERHRWEMTFAGGGEEALLQLDGAPYDIVLSDMRMPRMDGAELLAKVKELHPSTARMVLSAQASREAVLRAIPVAQQLLPKPCDAAVLVSVFDRTLRLKSLLANQAICDVAGKLDALPSVPQTYLELTETAARRNSGVADLATVVERDPAMSAKVLQLVSCVSRESHSSRQAARRSRYAKRLTLASRRHFFGARRCRWRSLFETLWRFLAIAPGGSWHGSLQGKTACPCVAFRSSMDWHLLHQLLVGCLPAF
jgi:DNA-binding NarL/FixJ family response regulator